MKKILFSPALTAGILALFVPTTNAATITVQNTLDLRLSPNTGNLSLPKFDLTQFPGATLDTVNIRVDGTSNGQIRLTNPGSISVQYRIDAGTLLGINGPVNGSSISLDLAVLQRNINGFLAPNTTAPPIDLSSQASQTRPINSSFFGLYTFTGTGDRFVNFDIASQNQRSVTIIGDGDLLSALATTSGVTISAIYNFTPPSPPLEIPDRSFGPIGVGFCLLTGLALKILHQA
jgi:hypothetical protein